MSATFASIFCGLTSLESVDDRKPMPFFCRSRRPDFTYHDVAEYPLLEHRPSNNERHSKPTHEMKPIVTVDGQFSKSNRRREPKPNEVKSSRPSHSVSQDVASAWMEMGDKSVASSSAHAVAMSKTVRKGTGIGTSGTSSVKSSGTSVVWPLQNSTRLNRMTVPVNKCFSEQHSTAVPADRSPDVSVHTVQRVRMTSLKPSPVYTLRGTTTGSTGPNTPKRSGSTRRVGLFAPINLFAIPPPPPEISYRRRFRVCFGVMSDWESAVDPKTGRTYYYNALTRETQWRKPIELATDDERILMEEKERKQREFFSAMEANIIKSMASGGTVAAAAAAAAATPPIVQRKPSLQPSRPGRIVRTISSMSEGTLKDMIKRTPSTRNLMQRSTADSIKALPLEKIVEADDMDQSSLDFGNSSISMFDESLADLGGSMSEVMALRALARISEEMMSASGQEDDVDYSMSDGLDISMQGSSLDFSDSLDMSSLDFMLPEKVTGKARRETSLDSLVFSPDIVEKKDVTTTLEPGEIYFTPDPPEPKAVVEEEPKQRSLKAKPPLIKRNTCGTLYVEATMSAPDKDATIKCICGVFRAHILAAEQDEKDSNLLYDPTADKYRLFNDRESERSACVSVEEELSLEDLNLAATEVVVPSLDTITAFYRNVFSRAQMETDCIIMSLIYVERLIKVTSGVLRPRRSNWRSLLFSCMILSSKVWDDLSMWNSDFSQTCPVGVHFSVKRINELELAILKALGYKVKVLASEYAKYYFLLRSMLIKSGLGGDDLRKMNPLDVEDAKRLEQLSTNFQNLAASKRRARKQDSLRSKSMGDSDKEKLRGGKMHASLEHMVKM